MKSGNLFAMMIAFFFVLLLFTPPYDAKKLNAGVYYHTAAGSKELSERLAGMNVLFYKESAYAPAAVEESSPVTTVQSQAQGTVVVPYNLTFKGNNRVLRINGMIQCGSSKLDIRTNTLLAALPVIFHGKPKTALNIGLGCGLTLGVLEQAQLERIDTIEIDPAIVEAAAYFSDWNSNALDDPRSNVIIADARNYLLSSAEKYDVIVNEPPQPWAQTGASLYSKEFFEIMKNHLSEGGVVSQWLLLSRFSEDDFKSFYRTFSSVFPYVRGYVSKIETPLSVKINENGTFITKWGTDYSEMILVGSAEPLEEKSEEMKNALEQAGIKDIDEFYILDERQLEGFATNAPMNTDDYPLIEFSTARKTQARPQLVMDAIRNYIASQPRI